MFGRFEHDLSHHFGVGIHRTGKEGALGSQYQFSNIEGVFNGSLW